MKEIFAIIGFIVLAIAVIIGIALGLGVIEDNLGYKECRQLYGQDYKYDSSSNLCVAPDGSVKAAE